MVAVAKRKQEDPAFGNRLRELRDRAELSQASLAEKAGVEANTIARLERGERKPSWQTVVSLARALGVTPDAFLTDTEE